MLDESDNVIHLTRDQLRNRRPPFPRARSVAQRDIGKRHLKMMQELEPYPDDVSRPRTRGECADMPRPCPWISCRYHLYLDVNPKNGSIKFLRPELEPWELPETCALDVADRQGATLDEVGALYNLTRERIRQLQGKAFAHLERKPGAMRLLAELGEQLDDHSRLGSSA